MASQEVEFIAQTGLTITASLFALQTSGGFSDTIYASASATENTNALGTYRCTFTDADKGTYKFIGFAAGVPVCVYYVSLSIPLG